MTDTKTPPPQVWPTLAANDAPALIRFLVDVFGFVETVVHGEGDRVEHAELSWPPGGGIMLGSYRGPEDPRWPLRPGMFGCYVVTTEPDALYERAVQAGAEVVRKLDDTDHGSRDFVVKDPEGNLWSFGTYRGAPTRG